MYIKKISFGNFQTEIIGISVKKVLIEVTINEDRLQMDSDKIKGLVLGFIATFSWASFYIVSRYFFGTDNDGLDPLWSSCMRYLIASFILFGCLITRKQFFAFGTALKKEWKMLFLLGMIGIVGNSTLLFYSMKFTTAARSNLLTNISPVATAVMSWFITREVFSRSQIFGMVLGFLGMCTVFFLRGGDNFSGESTSFLAGDLMAVAAGICWSAFTVLGERAVRQYGPYVTMCGAFMFGALAMIPIMGFAGSKVTLSIDLRGWITILYLGIIPNALGYACWYAALKYLRPGELGSFGYVSIVLTFLLAYCFLGEKITLPFGVCLTMILLGTCMMLKNHRNESPKDKIKGLS